MVLVLNDAGYTMPAPLRMRGIEDRQQSCQEYASAYSKRLSWSIGCLSKGAPLGLAPPTLGVPLIDGRALVVPAITHHQVHGTALWMGIPTELCALSASGYSHRLVRDMGLEYDGVVMQSALKPLLYAPTRSTPHAELHSSRVLLKTGKERS